MSSLAIEQFSLAIEQLMGEYQEFAAAEVERLRQALREREKAGGES